MAKHKTLGQVYTPEWIVNEILDLLAYDNEHILNKYILEPASGDGVFLFEIVSRYIDICVKNNMQTELIIEHLEKYIYGVEIDKVEFEKSIKSLNLLVKKKLATDKKPNWKIYNENTLDFYKNHTEHFDFIVGNPPYIRIHNLDEKTRHILKQEFIFSKGTTDMYLSFFEMGFKMLKDNGCLGYITPNSYLHNSSYKLFREYLKTKKTVKTLIDFKANKIFKGFSAYTAITIIKKNNKQDFFEYKELDGDKIKFVNKVYFDKINKKDWSFSNADDEAFLENLGRGKNGMIKDFFDVQYGFATLRDKIFISKIEAYDENLVYFNGSLVEKSILKTVVKGSRFKGEIDNSQKILFPYQFENKRYKVIEEEILKQNYPNAYKYLLKNKSELEKRDLDKNALWYEFGRSQGVQSIHNEKIILSTLVNGKINFYRVPENIMMYSGLFIIKNKKFSDWKLIERILKSEEFHRYIRLTGKDFSGGYKSISSKQIKEFKVKVDNPARLF